MSHVNIESNSRRARRQVEEFARLLEKAELRETAPEVSAQTSATPAVEAPQFTELSVDLPQGQRLTVKGLEPGTIVEVASWSGSGGPDEGAVRMLFGASGDDKKMEESAESKSLETSSGSMKGSMDVVFADDLRHDSGIDDIFGDSTEIDQVPPAIKHRAMADDSGVPKGRRIMKRIIVVTSVILGAVAIVVGLRLTDTVYFEHPSQGISTSLGGAETSIVAVNPGSDVEPNSTIIARIDGELAMVAVAQVGGNQYLVYDGAGQTVVVSEDVVGRVLFVIPFIGYIAGVFS